MGCCPVGAAASLAEAADVCARESGAGEPGTDAGVSRGRGGT